ncbi:hypothetical protein H0H81_006202 [Sphagnurus paluster]|uniref:CENP-C homolog n=1 Tax=Sphagnurus paluster TaxID=117069 RepID=A0A9P7KM13_9AGAR|nr:hypothetical protein H0H81_006202 [Sphagnurus paluster]
MPSSARKSSISAARRGAQKAHIPYRGDNPEVGKKTGIAVQHVERKSDGFEPFEELIQQADKRTPPKPKGRKKKAAPVIEEDNDELGEMSMELDDSPMQYFANSRQVVTPTSSRHGSSRPVTRTSDIDFDQIPSPRSSRKSTGHSLGPGPSRLSHSFHAQDMDQDSDGGDNHPNQEGSEDYDVRPPGGSGVHNSPAGPSFAAMDQDDDDDSDDVPEAGYDDVPVGEEPEEEEPPPPAKPEKGKGKGRAVLPNVPEEPESEVENEIAQSLADVNGQDFSDDDHGAEEPHPEPSPRRKKKAKFAEEPPKPRRASKSKKENRVYREGVRKSAREHYKPLEYWRGEKLVYGRGERAGTGLVLVPPIREIVRIPKEEPEPLGKRKRSRARSKSKALEEVKVVPITNPEEGWDDDTEPHCVVLDYETNEEVERRIAFTWKMLNPKQSATDEWKFQKVFGDADFIAGGVIILPPNTRKQTKQTKDNTYIFYVIEGALNLKIHDTSLVLATGAMFIVPRGNAYFIENIADRDTKLFFTQARIPKLPESAPSGNHIAPPRSSVDARRPPAPVRSSSAAPQVDGRPTSKPPKTKRAASNR